MTKERPAAPSSLDSSLDYVYVGVEDTSRSVAFYRDVLGATVVWRFRRFGADVAAIRLGAGPLLLLADHRPVPSVMPIYTVQDLAATMSSLAARGWKEAGPPMETPDGPAVTFRDPDGNPLAFLQRDGPEAMGKAFADPANSSAVRDEPPATPE